MTLKELYEKGADMQLTINHFGTDFLDVQYHEHTYTWRVNADTVRQYFTDNSWDLNRLKMDYI